MRVPTPRLVAVAALLLIVGASPATAFNPLAAVGEPADALSERSSPNSALHLLQDPPTRVCRSLGDSCASDEDCRGPWPAFHSGHFRACVGQTCRKNTCGQLDRRNSGSCSDANEFCNNGQCTALLGEGAACKTTFWPNGGCDAAFVCGRVAPAPTPGASAVFECQKASFWQGRACTLHSECGELEARCSNDKCETVIHVSAGADCPSGAGYASVVCELGLGSCVTESGKSVCRRQLRTKEGCAAKCTDSAQCDSGACDTKLGCFWKHTKFVDEECSTHEECQSRHCSADNVCVGFDCADFPCNDEHYYCGMRAVLGQDMPFCRASPLACSVGEGGDSEYFDVQRALCAAKKPLGHDCSDDSVCKSGHCDTGGLSTCVNYDPSVPRPKGTYCKTSAECEQGLVCFVNAASLTPGHCAAPLVADALCNAYRTACAPGLRCLHARGEDFRCQTSDSYGKVCTTDRDCHEGQQCLCTGTAQPPVCLADHDPAFAEPFPERILPEDPELEERIRCRTQEDQVIHHCHGSPSGVVFAQSIVRVLSAVYEPSQTRKALSNMLAQWGTAPSECQEAIAAFLCCDACGTLELWPEHVLSMQERRGMAGFPYLNGEAELNCKGKPSLIVEESCQPTLADELREDRATFEALLKPLGCAAKSSLSSSQLAWIIVGSIVGVCILVAVVVIAVKRKKGAAATGGAFASLEEPATGGSVNAGGDTGAAYDVYGSSAAPTKTEYDVYTPYQGPETDE